MPHDPQIHQKNLWPTLLNEFASQKHLKSAEMASFSLMVPISADLKGLWQIHFLKLAMQQQKQTAVSLVYCGISEKAHQVISRVGGCISIPYFL